MDTEIGRKDSGKWLRRRGTFCFFVGLYSGILSLTMIFDWLKMLFLSLVDAT
jgi:hypothetical protein